jgi:SAM-dependent methyltransferase
MPHRIAEPGLQIDVAEPELQAYLQRYPFASGPDAAMNARGLRAAAAIRLRPAVETRETVLLTPEATQLCGVEEARLQALFERVGMSAAGQRRHRDDFAWEASRVPRAAQDVLVIGSGDGIELLFLRAVLPQARLTAIDYYPSLLPGIAEAVGLPPGGFSFLEGDMHEHLRGLQREYDLIFSNHTLEHLYAPDATLALLAGLLVTGGSMVSTLPLMGQPGSPYLERVRAFIAEGKTKVHALDAVFFDLGHPWKTNPADLRATLERAGFDEVTIYQRTGHRCRPRAATDAEIARARARRMALYAVLLAPLRRVAKALCALGGCAWVPRAFYALDRRLSFGVNRTMNEWSEEACFLAKVQVAKVQAATIAG